MTAQEDKVATACSITSKLVLNLYGNEEVSDLTVFMPIAQKNEYHTVWRIRVSDGFIYEGQRGLQKKKDPDGDYFGVYDGDCIIGAQDIFLK